MDNTDRSWMYRRLENGFLSSEFCVGVETFVSFALSHPECLLDGKLRCPCNRKKCRNKCFEEAETVKFHLGRYGFVPNYYCWQFHGDQYVPPMFPNFNMEAPSSSTCFVNRSTQQEFIDPIQSDQYFCNTEHGNTYFDDTNQNETNEFAEENPHTDSGNDDPQSPNSPVKSLYEMIKSAEKEIWDGNPHGHSLLSVLARLLKMKQEHNMSERNYNDMCQLMSELCPSDNSVPESFYATKKLIKDLGLPVEKIDVCQNNCMIYWGEDDSLTECKICQHPRYRRSRRRSTNRKTQTPYKKMYYFPITQRLQRLYASTATASHMRWHKEHHFDGETMTHPSDSPAWRHFDAMHPSFASEIRNVRLGMSTDGFQPFGQSGQQYSSWPVIVTPYNLPPWMCMKEEYMFLTVIVPGPHNPKDKLDVFLQPLIAELQSLWCSGVQTYDMHSKQNFNLRVALLWTISDFPAYAMLSGWSTAGKQACPHCMSDSNAFTLPCSGKTSWFDNHRKFLPEDHPLRRNRVMFIRGRRVLDPAPIVKQGDELLNELEEYGFRPSYEVDSETINKEIASYVQCGWRRRSILWELPYWSTNLIRHNLDVMHVEKNVFDNVFNTVCNIQGRTKDNAKTRADLVQMNIRPELHPDGETGQYPKAAYTLDRRGRQVLFGWLKDVKFCDGYVSKMARCVDMQKLRMFGMKSHDCHVFMQRLIPVAFRELLPRHVWEVLTELSLFFADLTSRNIKQSDMMRLNDDIVLILCKLEKIFPPSFFDSMEHLCVHLPFEARIAGPVQFRWMYPFERFLRKLKNTVRNKARVEGSICNAYLVKEASIFCQYYFNETSTARGRKRRQHQATYEDTGSTEMLSIFRSRGRKIGAGRSRWLTADEYQELATYILLNCEEITPFVRMYEDYLHRENPHLNDANIDSLLHTNLFGWFKNYAELQSAESMSPMIKQVAAGPFQKVNTYRGYNVNGFNFHTVNDTTYKATNNSGIQVSGQYKRGECTEYYGQVQEVIEVEYSGLPLKQAILFKFSWFDINPRSGTRVHSKYKIVNVNCNRRLGSWEPFVFATQASQVVYLRYPTTRRAVSEWMYVSSLRQRAYVSDVTAPVTSPDDITNAFQNNDSETHAIETQFLLASQNLVDVDVVYDIEMDVYSTDSERDESVPTDDDERQCHQSD
ncbi:uncharacterized protein [Primulina huaijiensis]|uniref:uncharacterized protein n=1 Tax=Primulina huaijiensis TaxID=1492673 RepID=UPI003CC72EB8